MTMQDYYRDPTLRVDADALERMQAFQFKAGFQKRAPMSGRWSISAICRNEAADKYAAAPLPGRAARSDDPIRNRSSSGDSTCAEVAMARCADWRVLWRCWLRAQARRWHKAPPCGSATARRRKSRIWLVVAKPDLGKNQGKAYTLDATRFTGSDKRGQAFEAGAIDLAASSANGVIFAAAEGVTAKIIASVSRESSRGFSTSFYVKENSPIKSVSDLKGKIVGINGTPRVTSGSKPRSRSMGSPRPTSRSRRSVPRDAEALDAGKVDLGQFPQPFAALTEKQMNVRKIFDAKYGVPFEEELIVLIGKDEFLKKNAPAIRASSKTWKSSTQFYLEKPREARQLLVDRKMVRVNPEVYVGMNDYYRDPSLQVDVEALEKMQAFQIKAGFQKKHADVKSLVDLSYLPK